MSTPLERAKQLAQKTRQERINNPEFTPFEQNAKTVTCVRDMRKINQANGSHFFDLDTLKWWGSRFHGVKALTDVIVVFISSEKNFQGTARLYTVRYMWTMTRQAGDTETLSEFQQFASLVAARRWLKAFVKLAKTAGPIANDAKMSELAATIQASFE